METKIVHITTARGPAECQLAASKVLGHFLDELRSANVNAMVLERTPGQENGTVLSATVQVTGKQISSVIHPWLGTIQWIQKSPYRPNHGRKNWFVGVFELKTLSVGSSWSEDDLIFQAVRSSGAGGQHVNKVSSAVRVTHSPTGISVFVQDNRSQIRNKKLARQRIAEKLEAYLNRGVAEQAEQQWSQQENLQRGNPVKVFTWMDLKPKPKKSFKERRSKLKQEMYKELRS